MTHALTEEQRRFYETNGYILLKRVFEPQEMELMRREMHALAERLAARHIESDVTWVSVRTGQTTIRHCHDVQFHSAAATRLITDPRFTGPLQSLIGPNIQLHHSKMFIKPPEKGSPFPMHQDYNYFPHERNTMTAAIIHFDHAPIEKGCVRVVPGSHKLGPLPYENHDLSLSHERFPISEAKPCEAEPGDVLIFNYLTIHGSGVNRSQESRTTLLVQIRDPEDQPLKMIHMSRGQGMMLAGIDPRCAAPPACADDPVATAAK